MILTLSTAHRPATDLGFLLHKHPDRVHAVPLSFGTAVVIFPEANAERASACLIVDVDAVGLVRRQKGGGSGFSLEPYVNDRPYAASSFLSVALGKAFSTAMSGRCKERPDLANQPIALDVSLPVVGCRGGDELIRRLFEPLGYAVGATPIAIDPQWPDWGDSRYLALQLSGTLRLKDLLQHLFVLLPVLDDDKHYWVGADEVDKLLHRGGDWLAIHPERELIAARYLRHDRALTSQAIARLSEDDPVDPDEMSATNDAQEQIVEATATLNQPTLNQPTLNQQRLAAVVDVVASTGARRVVDLGCGEGRLVQALLTTTNVERVVGLDVSHFALERAARRLHLESMAPRQRQRVELLQGSLTYRDARLGDFDAATLVEVIEHVEPSRLTSLERVVFGHAHPGVIVVTTPNAEYNVRFEGLAAGALRHRDHRFEWTRAELAAWATGVADRHGYEVTFSGIGSDDPEVGSPTQMAVFRTRRAS